jgi:hypothetical protein
MLQVIVDRYAKEKVLPALDKNRFLLPEDLTVAQFLSIIRLASLPYAILTAWLINSLGFEIHFGINSEISNS